MNIPNETKKKDHSKLQSMDKCFARDASLVFNSAQTNWISERSWTYYTSNMLIKASKVADSKMTKKKIFKRRPRFWFIDFFSETSTKKKYLNELHFPLKENLFIQHKERLSTTNV